ncbi:MAG: M48 family metalloprotease [Candidatus Omnitrophica bacterium]|nr:M48 family metalloprotease [Candidatus Omnitrophota bacterium]
MAYSVVFGLLSLVFGLIFSGCLSTEYSIATHKQDVMMFSTASEISLGGNVSRSIAKQVEISKSPFDIERVNDIGGKIADVCDRKEVSYYFYVINEEDEKNAFCIPGGHVYIFKELMDFLSDDALAFVLAHEVSHVVCRHGIKRMQAALGYNVLLAASAMSNSDSNFPGGVSFALSQLMAAHSREDELKADELAVKYMKLAGFDPNAGLEALEKLYELDKKKIRTGSYFKSHPYTAQRIAQVKEAQNIPWDVNDYLNF